MISEAEIVFVTVSEAAIEIAYEAAVEIAFEMASEAAVEIAFEIAFEIVFCSLHLDPPSQAAHAGFKLESMLNSRPCMSRSVEVSITMKCMRVEMSMPMSITRINQKINK